MLSILFDVCLIAVLFVKYWFLSNKQQTETSIEHMRVKNQMNLTRYIYQQNNRARKLLKYFHIFRLQPYTYHLIFK